MTFAQNLAVGQLGESTIAQWCKSRGNSVLPVYEKEIDTGKGPRFFTPAGQLVAPDMFVLPSMNWLESKHKSHFTWYRAKGQWETGIDLKHYLDYIEVQRVSGRPVWLLFLHRDPIPDRRDLDQGSPQRCPIGLYGGSLDHMQAHESHRSDRWGRSGMVYWAADDLTRLATMDEIERLAA